MSIYLIEVLSLIRNHDNKRDDLVVHCAYHLIIPVVNCDTLDQGLVGAECGKHEYQAYLS